MSQPVSRAQSAAQAYHEYMVPAMFDPWAQLLVGQAAIRAGERVLDVACGTGAVARRAAWQVGAGGQVSALDLNPVMLEVARRQSVPEGAAITWVQGSAQSLPFPDGSFEVVLCQHGLPFFPDPALALAEMRRVLRPGGRLLVTVWRSLDHSPLFSALNEAAVRLIGLPVYGAPFVLGAPGMIERLLVGAGFEEALVSEQTRELCFATPEHFVARNLQASSAAIPMLAALDETERTKLAERMQSEMGALLAASTRGEMLVTPMTGIIGQARR
ncbi:class I SAM-dependent methyltransferase [Deinococcus sp.]|uniref:class I SAM-dependent methyltransferase n=1 Tax=Deinococcus sp. TaxID=47478 RepID=UPI003C7E7052